MDKINFTRKYHAVGHGCFYSESLKIGNKDPITIVYDCGALPQKQLIKEISDFEIKFIDLLVISHLDGDHKNGIKLLKEKCVIRKVIIPKLSLLDFAYYFYFDKTVKEILFNNNNFWGKTKVIVLEDESKNDGTYDLEELPLKLNHKARIRFYNQTDIVWDVKFYLDKAIFEKMTTGQNSFFERERKIDQFMQEMSKLSQEYNSVKINLTSISMYSKIKVTRTRCMKSIPVSVMNGDADLRVKKLDNFLNHFKELESEEIDFHLPHHGSEYNLSGPIKKWNVKEYIAMENTTRSLKYLQWLDKKFVKKGKKVKYLTEIDENYVKELMCDECTDNMQGQCELRSL